MTGQKDWLEEGVNNVGASFLVGSVYGFLKGYYEVAPPHQTYRPFMKKINTLQIANVAAHTSFQFMVYGAVYTFGSCVASSIRGKDDSVNAGLGGATLGGLLGLRKGTFHSVFTSTIGFGTLAILNAFVINGFKRDAEEKGRYKILLSGSSQSH